MEPSEASAGYVSCNGIDIVGTLRKIEKSKEALSPLFEATSNALDAIQHAREKQKPFIKVVFQFDAQLIEQPRRLAYIEIEDSGIGITDVDYRRLSRLNDCSKSALNKGSGRLQFVKYFALTTFESVFEDSKRKTGKALRKCELSTAKDFIDANAIVKHIAPTDANAEKPTGTVVRFTQPLCREDRDFYERIELEELKEKFISHFFLRFSQEKDLPTITFVFRVGESENSTEITEKDVPTPCEEKVFQVPYKRASLSERGTVHWTLTDNYESFQLSVFLLSNSALGKNRELFVSRGESVADAGLKLAKNDEKLDGSHYMIAISGDYIDARVSETRGSLDIPTDEDVKRDLRAQRTLWDDKRDEYITVADIQEKAREVCVEALPELDKRKKQLRERVESVCSRFGIPKKTGERALKKLSLQDGRKKIFQKLYQIEATDCATKDEAFDAKAEEILQLDPSAEDYEERLRALSYDFFRSVPEENRAALTHYFARRRLVVSLLESILERRLAVQKDGKRNEDERLLHNVLFRQGSENPRQSDLWLLNEEFVYYSGVSNKPLKDVEYKGNKLFVDLSECSPEDREYLISGGENRTRQRPDILLFPEDGKCVIIELKRPDVNISEHLWQVNKYAGLIYAYCALEYKINRFYTYIIGENLNFRDVRNADSSYKPAPNFGYLYGVRSVPADGKPDAEQYMEAHSYSTLLKRAAFRNKTFFDLLFQDGEP